MGNDRSRSGMVRHTVAEAADMLGITTGAVRNRLSRGTLASTKEDWTVYVLLPAGMSRDAERDTDHTPGGIPPFDSNALTSVLRDRLHYVEEQLEAERLAHAEARRLLMAALERIPSQLEAPQEATEAQERGEEQQGRSEAHPDTPSAQEGAQRPWWRRVFGG